MLGLTEEEREGMNSKAQDVVAELRGLRFGEEYDEEEKAEEEEEINDFFSSLANR